MHLITGAPPEEMVNMTYEPEPDRRLDENNAFDTNDFNMNDFEDTHEQEFLYDQNAQHFETGLHTDERSSECISDFEKVFMIFIDYTL